MQALAQDGSGNPVAGVSVTFTAPNSGASGLFPGSLLSASAPTDSAGIATAPAFTANATTGGYSVAPSALGATVLSSFTFTNNAATAPTADSVTGIVPGSLTQSLTFKYSSPGRIRQPRGCPGGFEWRPQWPELLLCLLHPVQ